MSSCMKPLEDLVNEVDQESIDWFEVYIDEYESVIVRRTKDEVASDRREGVQE